MRRRDFVTLLERDVRRTHDPASTMNRYFPQNVRMASCSAFTLGNPKCWAAELIPPNCWANADTLLP